MTKQRSRRGPWAPEPPQFNGVISGRHRFRYRASSAGVDISITCAELVKQLCMTLTTTTSAAICDRMKVRSVELWGPPSATFGSNTVSCEFSQDAGSPGMTSKPSVFSDTSMGATRVAYVKAVPPRSSLVDFWFSPQSGPFMTLNYPAEAVIDIAVEYTIANGTGLTTGPTLAAGTAGTVFCNPPDATLVPVSYQTQA